MRLKHQRMSKHKLTEDNILTILLRVLFVAIIVGLIWSQNHLLITKNFVFSSPDVPKNFVGYKIVHISDLCNSSISVTGKVKKCEPDIIVVSGGYFDVNGNYDNSIKQINELAKIAPVYYVYSPNDPQDCLSSTNATNMSNNIVELETKQLDAVAFIKKVYGNKIIKEANNGNEEAQQYMDYIDEKLAELNGTTIALIGLDRNDDKETGTDTALQQAYDLLMKSSSEYTMGIVGNARTIPNVSNSRLKLAFTGGTFGTKTISQTYTKGVYNIKSVATFFCGGVGTYTNKDGNKVRRIFNFPEIQCITLSDGTLSDDNPLEKFIGIFWDDVGTVFDNDGGFSPKQLDIN